MDALESLYRRLVQNVRTASPDLFQSPIEVAQVYQQLVPYRTNRRELGIASAEEYELALCQLLSGARGLLDGDPDMQEALRSELESPNPDLAAYRSYATARVRLRPEPLREALRAGAPSAATPAPTGERPVDVASRPTRETSAGSVQPPASQGAAAPRPAAPPRPTAPAPAPAPVAPVAAAAPAAPTAPAPVAAHPNRAPEAPMSSARVVPIQARQGDNCRYCGGHLPAGRSVVYCPGCGHNLTIKHCAACNTEMEVGWKYCITCGRENDANRAAAPQTG